MEETWGVNSQVLLCYNRYMPLPIPSQNQPIDYDFINTIATEFNNMEKKVSSLVYNTQTSIDGKTMTPNDVVFWADTIEIENPSGTSKYITAQVVFSGVSFKNPPIVTATPATQLSGTTVTLTIYDISTAGCRINAVFASTPTTAALPKLAINVIAIGQRAASS